MTLERDCLRMLCEVTLKAGAVVKAIYDTPFHHWEKSDASPVTDADLQADVIIRDGLQSAFPGVCVVSEECAADAHTGADRFFLVDAVDGTREFLSRNGEFTVNVALIVCGRAVAGAVYAPALNELFYAAEGLGAFKAIGAEPARIRARAADRGCPLRVIGSRSHATGPLDAWLASLQQSYTFVAAGSSLKFCRIAEGRADLYPRFGPTNQWDTAAAQCVLEQAGGRVTTLCGTPLEYGLDRPMLNPPFAAAGDPALLALIRPPAGPTAA